MFSTGEKKTHTHQTHNRISWNMEKDTAEYTIHVHWMLHYCRPSNPNMVEGTCILWLFCSNESNSGMWSSLYATRCCFRLDSSSLLLNRLWWWLLSPSVCKHSSLCPFKDTLDIFFSLISLCHFSFLDFYLERMTKRTDSHIDGVLQIKNRKLKEKVVNEYEYCSYDSFAHKLQCFKVQWSHHKSFTRQKIGTKYMQKMRVASNVCLFTCMWSRCRTNANIEIGSRERDI